MAQCRYFKRTGACPFGHNCPDQHGTGGTTFGSVFGGGIQTANPFGTTPRAPAGGNVTNNPFGNPSFAGGGFIGGFTGGIGGSGCTPNASPFGNVENGNVSATLGGGAVAKSPFGQNHGGSGFGTNAAPDSSGQVTLSPFGQSAGTTQPPSGGGQLFFSHGGSALAAGQGTGVFGNSLFSGAAPSSNANGVSGSSIFGNNTTSQPAAESIFGGSHARPIGAIQSAQSIFSAGATSEALGNNGATGIFSSQFSPGGGIATSSPGATSKAEITASPFGEPGPKLTTSGPTTSNSVFGSFGSGADSTGLYGKRDATAAAGSGLFGRSSDDSKPSGEAAPSSLFGVNPAVDKRFVQRNIFGAKTKLPETDRTMKTAASESGVFGTKESVKTTQLEASPAAKPTIFGSKEPAVTTDAVAVPAHKPSILGGKDPAAISVSEASPALKPGVFGSRQPTATGGAAPALASNLAAPKPPIFGSYIPVAEGQSAAKVSGGLATKAIGPMAPGQSMPGLEVPGEISEDIAAPSAESPQSSAAGTPVKAIKPSDVITSPMPPSSSIRSSEINGTAPLKGVAAKRVDSRTLAEVAQAPISTTIVTQPEFCSMAYRAPMFEIGRIPELPPSA